MILELGGSILSSLFKGFWVGLDGFPTHGISFHFYCFKKLLVVLHFVANAYYHRQDHVLDEIQPSRRLKVCRDGVSCVRMVCRVYLRNNG